MTHPLTDADLAMAARDPSTDPMAWNAGMQAIDDFFPDFFDLEAASLKEDTVSKTNGSGAEDVVMGDAGSAEVEEQVAQQASGDGEKAGVLTADVQQDKVASQVSNGDAQSSEIHTSNIHAQETQKNVEIREAEVNHGMQIEDLADYEATASTAAQPTLLDAEARARIDALVDRACIDQMIIEESGRKPTDMSAAYNGGEETAHPEPSNPQTRLAPQGQSYGQQQSGTRSLIAATDTKQPPPPMVDQRHNMSQKQFEQTFPYGTPQEPRSEQLVAIKSAYEGVAVASSTNHKKSLPSAAGQPRFLSQKDFEQTYPDATLESRFQPTEQPQQPTAAAPASNVLQVGAATGSSNNHQSSSIYDSDLPFADQPNRSPRGPRQHKPPSLSINTTAKVGPGLQNLQPSGPNTTSNTPLATPLLPSAFPDAASTPIHSPAGYDRNRQSHSTPGAKSLRREMTNEEPEDEIDVLTPIGFKGAKPDMTVPEALKEPFGVVGEKRAHSPESSPDPWTGDSGKTKELSGSPPKKKVKLVTAVHAANEETQTVQDEQEVSEEAGEDDEPDADGESDDEATKPTSPPVARLSGLSLSLPDFSSSMSSVDETVLQNPSNGPGTDQEKQAPTAKAKKQPKPKPAPKAPAAAKPRKQPAAPKPAKAPTAAAKKAAPATRKAPPKPPVAATTKLTKIAPKPAPEPDTNAPKKVVGGHLLGKRELSELGIAEAPEPKRTRVTGAHPLGAGELQRLNGSAKGTQKASPRKTRGQAEKKEKADADAKPNAAAAARRRKSVKSEK